MSNSEGRLAVRGRVRLRGLGLDRESTYRQTELMSSKPNPQKVRADSRQIVGFSLPPAVATEVKIEAARCNVSLKDLFGEMWALYKKHQEMRSASQGTDVGQSR